MPASSTATFSRGIHLPDALSIRNVTLIDGRGSAPVEGASILIEDGRISAVDAGAISKPKGAETLDARGLWAIPGLIDTHLHLALVGREALPLMLGMGLTTVRDLGSAIDFVVETRRLLEDGASGPRLLFTGPMIDGEPPTWPNLVHPTPDAETAARVVEEHLGAGADAIKLYTTLPLESLTRCIQQVDRRVPVTGHLGLTLASEAMEAGIDGLEHALLTPYNDLAPEDQKTGPGETMTTPGFWQKVNAGWLQADLTTDHARRWIELLVERDVFLSPTLTVVPGADESDGDEFDHLPTLRGRQEERMRLRAAQGGQVGRRLPEIAPEYRQLLRKVRAKLQELVLRVHQAGGRVVSGTDTGAVGNLVPGFSLHRELGHLSQAGLSNMDVLRAATARAAEALWRSDIGTIEPGKRADLLLLRRDPLEDLSALKDIERVIQGGRVLDPAALLAEARAAR